MTSELNLAGSDLREDFAQQAESNLAATGLLRGGGVRRTPLSPQALHPRPYTPGPTPRPYTPGPTPQALHPGPYTPGPAPQALHPRPYTPGPAPQALHPRPYTLCRAAL